MNKIALIGGLLLVAGTAFAAITVGTAPTSLVTSATSLTASTEKAVFEFGLTADNSETLSSVSVTVNSSTASNSDLAAVKVYRDDGDSSFDSGDNQAGANTSVNIGSTTLISTASNNTLTGAKFFVVLATSSNWSGTDSVTVTLNANGVNASDNSPTSNAVTTAALSADASGPVLQTAMAHNKVGGTGAIEAGDYVVLTFSEATNKPAITAANIESALDLNNSHSWLDGVASIGTTAWSADGTQLTVTLSAGTSVPNLAIGDTVTATGSVIKDVSDNNASGTATITGSFGAADSTGPVLNSAAAKNTGGTSSKEGGDSVVLTFSEATNKPTINSSNIDTVLDLNNSHSWLDGNGGLGSTSWSSDGLKLTVTLSDDTSVPTVEVGDTVTVSDSVIKDSSNNNATGNKIITGSFTTTTSDDEDEDDDVDFGKSCGAIINGRLYKVAGSDTVYLAAACRLKPFRGAAVFHARGYKFQNIIVLSSLNGLTISDKPALPAGGTLVKGSDKTVWFVTEHGKRKGFTSENAFKRLGFDFGSVKVISDSDLQFITPDTDIDENSDHPDGAVIRCSNSATVYMMNGKQKHAFTNPNPYLDRGHTWDAIAVINCSVFPYADGSEIDE